jgi:hypothetical protein
MSLLRLFYLVCCDCSDQFTSRTGDHYAESGKEVREQAKSEGWLYVKVENGSFWDICPRCQRDKR